ncbi:MAG: efflux RND transporter periplasmic adaptor subunit [Gemmatimonadetes bacterium]|nr:efflux RND transporter periplasmic adaptor subunit [Gemmatimonadota bacterium]
MSHLSCRRVARLLPAALTLAAACNDGAGAAATAVELPGGAVTLWTDSTELFMEHPALIVGKPDKFAVHLTDLTDFAPLRSGRILLHFEPVGGGEGFTIVQEAPRAPGIYGPSPSFPRAGQWELTISVESPQARDEIRVPALTVYASEADVPGEDDGEAGGIPFLKEQQWKTPGFRTGFAVAGMVPESFETTGEVIPASGRTASVTAPIAGLLEADGLANAPVEGQRVSKGEVLVTLLPLLGEGGSAYAEARGALREAEDEFARVQRLHAVEAVPERRVHEARSRLQVAREALAGLSGSTAASEDGRLVLRAPIGGVVTARHAAAGARVAAGSRSSPSSIPRWSGSGPTCRPRKRGACGGRRAPPSWWRGRRWCTRPAAPCRWAPCSTR